jgi:hypothetical protein
MPEKSGHFDGHTEYADNYQKYGSGGPSKSFKPVLQVISGGEFHGATDYKDKFVPHRVERIQIRKNVHEPINNGKFEGTTNYQQEYHPHELSKRVPRAKATWKTAGDFSGATTNRTDFQKWDIPPMSARPKAEYVPSEVKFEGSSIQKEDFRQWPIERPPQREKEIYKPATEDRDFLTDTRTSFVPHPLQNNRVHHKAEYKPSPDKFNGISTHREDFKKWEIPKFYVHPPAKALIYPEDRDFGTTTSVAYVPHKAEKTKAFRPAHNAVDSGKFDGTTVAKEAYQVWPIPEKIQRPKAKYISAGSFEGSSTYHDSYLAKSAPLYQREQPKYVPSNLKFEGRSTHQSDFVPLPYQANIVKHREQYNAAKEERDFATQTRLAYTPKSLPGCPVIDKLKTNAYQRKGEDGHLYPNISAPASMADVSKADSVTA